MTEDTGVIDEQVAEAQVADQSNEPRVSDKDFNFERLREAAEASKQEAEYWRMQALQQQQAKQQQPQNDGFDLDKYADDDVPTYGELKKLKAAERRQNEQYLQQINELKMQSQHADYADVIKNYLPDVLQEDPDLAIAIKDNPMVQKLAYRLAKSSPKYHENRLAKQNSSVLNKINENMSRPAPATARKSVAAFSDDVKYDQMSDEQIMATFNMAKAMS